MSWICRSSALLMMGHRALVDRIHGGIGHLGEELLEVVVEHARAIREAGQRRVVAHGSNGPLAVDDHRSDQELEVLLGVPEDLLESETQVRVHVALWRLGGREIREPHAAPLDPLAIRLARHIVGLDLLVFDDASLFEVDEEDAPRLQAALLEHVLGRHIENTHLRSHHDETVLRHDPARGAKTVAVEDRADLAPIRERDRGGSVPGLHQEGVVFVVGAKLLAHLRVILPGLRDHHEDGLGKIPARQDQEFERAVELCRVARGLAHQGIELGEIVSKELRAQRPLARAHVVPVAPECVDLAVVGHVAEGLSEVPRAERVGAVARVHQREGRLHAGIVEIPVEGLDLARHQQTGEHEGAAREARNVEEARAPVRGVLEHATDHVELALEGVLLQTCAGRHEGLPYDRQPGARVAPDGARVVGNLAPPEHVLSLGVDQLLEEPHLTVAFERVLGEEDHARRVGPGRGQIDGEPLRLLAQKAVGKLDQDAGAIAGLRVAAAGAPVLEVHEHLDALVDQRVGRLAPDVRDEADSAGVVLAGGIVEPLGEAHLPVPRGRGPPARRVGRASNSSLSVRSTRARSVCVESTTIVSVRATPSSERMPSMSASSVSVLCVFTLSIKVCAPVT
jgi:hypothetical protein